MQKNKEKQILDFYGSCYEIFKHYGQETQLNKFAEECAELIHAILRKDKDNILEEMADVNVLLIQFTMSSVELCKKIDEISFKKVKRQMERIKNENQCQNIR